MIEKIQELKEGAVINESSHYIVKRERKEFLEATRFNLSQEMADMIV